MNSLEIRKEPEKKKYSVKMNHEEFMEMCLKREDELVTFIRSEHDPRIL